MSIEFIIFLVALLAIIIFFKNFYSCVYFVVIVDIFLRVVTYLKDNFFRADVFDFLNYVPGSVAHIIKSFDMAIFTEILLFVYILMYIIFEIIIIKQFIKKRF